MILKEDQPTSPAEFRPITVTSTILRLFHKILASRLDTIPINNAQKGFRTMDGICENIILSKSLIKRAQKESKLLCICLLDIKKAFDSVSHESLQRAIERKGMPQQIRKYIAQLYSQVTTTLKNNDNQTQISFTTWVLQGDPLSGTLFNLVLDMAFAPLEDGLGLDVGPHKLNCICFAEDTILVSDSPAGLQGLIDQATNEFRKVGLHLNRKKCATLRFSVNPARKISAVNLEPFIKINEFRAEEQVAYPVQGPNNRQLLQIPWNPVRSVRPR